jgi:hypothetical protein
VVTLRFFTDLTLPEIARSLGRLLATADLPWVYARLWPNAGLTDVGRPEEF